VQELRQVFLPDAEMAAGQLEGRQLPVVDPPQHGGIAHAAAPGDESDGYVFRGPWFVFFGQLAFRSAPPLATWQNRPFSKIGASGDCYVCSIGEPPHVFVTEIAPGLTGISQQVFRRRAFL
jgi:hypothetical protein